MADIFCEVVWLISLLQSLQSPSMLPVPLHCDNKSALHIARNPVFHEHTKHIEIDCHFVLDKFQAGFISPAHISTKTQPAYMFIKALPSYQIAFL